MDNEKPNFAAVAKWKVAKTDEAPEVECPEIDDEAVRAAIQAMKDAEALKDAVCAMVAPILHAKLVERSRADGRIYTAINCGGIQYVCQNRYQPVSSDEALASLKARLGEERFEQCFTEVYTYSFPSTAVDQELFAMLTAKGLVPSMQMRATPAYHAAMVFEPEFGEVSTERRKELRDQGVSVMPMPKTTAYVQRRPETKDGKVVHVRTAKPTNLPQVIRPVAAPAPAVAVEAAPAPAPATPAAPAAPATVPLKKVRTEIRKAMKALAEGGAK